MFKIKEKLIFTGKEKRQSKAGKEYNLVYFLGENGQSFSVISNIYPDDLKQLDEVQATIKVTPGRYITMELLSIAKI